MTTALEEQTAKLSLDSPRNFNIVYGFASLKGKRDRNEDTHVTIASLPDDPSTAFFAVYDGHGGKNASTYCKDKMHKNITERKCYKEDKKKAITKGFLRTDDNYLLKSKSDGCTACIALLTSSSSLYIGNAGDTRAVLRKKDNTTIALSKDHKPSDTSEKLRIENSGHEVVKETILVNGKREYMYRIDGTMGVSRSIGDHDYKDAFSLSPEQQAITAFPDVFEYKVEKGDLFMIACDGVWDVMTNEEATGFIKENYGKEKDLNKVADMLGNKAIEKGSEDNITVVIVSLE